MYSHGTRCLIKTYRGYGYNWRQQTLSSSSLQWRIVSKASAVVSVVGVVADVVAVTAGVAVGVAADVAATRRSGCR